MAGRSHRCTVRNDSILEDRNSCFHLVSRLFTWWKLISFFSSSLLSSSVFRMVHCLWESITSNDLYRNMIDYVMEMLRFVLVNCRTSGVKPSITGPRPAEHLCTLFYAFRLRFILYGLSHFLRQLCKYCTCVSLKLHFFVVLFVSCWLWLLRTLDTFKDKLSPLSGLLKKISNCLQ